ncbi:MAG: M23 family metallopeptidase [Actinomycetota bacterium]
MTCRESMSSASPPRPPRITRRHVRPARVVVAAVVAVAVGTSSFSALGQTTTEPPAEETTTTAPPAEDATTTAPPADDGATDQPPAAPEATTTTVLDAEAAAERDRAMANLNLAKAADVEIAAQLNAINEAANRTIDKIEDARKRIEVAQVIAERSREDLEASGEKQLEIESSLTTQAIEGFKTRSIEGGAGLLTQSGGTEALRQNQLLDQANSSTAELLEELRALLEDRRLASEEADRAARDAEAAEQELEAELDILKSQQAEQLGLKAEAERRIDQWAGELVAYAREDAAIQQLIGQSAAPIDTAINTPTEPSALGFQWPVVEGRVTSEYGYRIHPVYGTRRLHAGIDIGAPRGTPIASSNSGVVIFAGTQGGYGRTVIVDHGGGITTLYAHMTEIGASVGQLVDRGDIVGLVGATGTATGNHLHFEVRVNGGPSNPRNYLP